MNKQKEALIKIYALAKLSLDERVVKKDAIREIVCIIEGCFMERTK